MHPGNRDCYSDPVSVEQWCVWGWVMPWGNDSLWLAAALFDPCSFCKNQENQDCSILNVRD